MFAGKLPSRRAGIRSLAHGTLCAIKSVIGRLVETYFLARDIVLSTYGSWMLKDHALPVPVVFACQAEVGLQVLLDDLVSTVAEACAYLVNDADIRRRGW